jgi:hypothetical protein
MPVIPALRRLMQEDGELEDSLDRPCLTAPTTTTTTIAEKMWPYQRPQKMLAISA